MAYYYTSYGLCFKVNVPIPGLMPAEESSACFDLDVKLSSSEDRSWTQIRWGVADRLVNRRHRTSAQDTDPYILVSPDRKFHRFEYSDGVRITVDDTIRTVWVTYPDEFSVDYALAYLLNPVLGLCLKLRGQVCLHGSAVQIGDRALVIIGPSGAGKSTTATFLATRGHPIIADDICVLVNLDGHVGVQPAYPGLRLWPEAATAVVPNHDQLRLLAPEYTKLILDLNDRSFPFCDVPMPIGAVYVLSGRTQQPSIVREPPQAEALATLMDSTFMHYIVSKELYTANFAGLARLVDSVPVRFITVQHDLQELPALYQILMEDFLTLRKAEKTQDSD